jgi:hypothetical protein
MQIAKVIYLLQNIFKVKKWAIRKASTQQGATLIFDHLFLLSLIPAAYWS